MPFFTLNGIAIPIKSNAVTVKHNEHRLDRDRMFDGTMRVTRGGQAAKYGAGVYRQWDIATRSMSDADVAVLLGMVNGDTLPLALSGDIVGGDIVAVIPVPGTNNPVQTANGFRRLNAFTLHETPAPLPPDTSAAVYLAALRGKGYWKDFAKSAAAGDGDLVELWEDQSGNGRDLKCPTAFGGVCCKPKREGNLLHFGISDNTGIAGAPGDARSQLNVPIDIPTSDFYGTLAGCEFMIGFRLAVYPPPSDVTSGSWSFSSSGDAGSQFTTSTGHILERAFIDSGAGPVDLGVSPVDPSAGLVVYSVGATGATGHEKHIITLNGTTLYDDPSRIIAAGFHVNAQPVLGYVSAFGDKYMVGWVQDFVIFTDVLTASQRRSWYDYLRGATSDPPLP